MNQSQFEHAYESGWREFDAMLDELETFGKVTNVANIPLVEFPSRYRRVCNHYSLAKARHYRPALVDRVHDLVLRGHRQLYRRKTHLLWTAIHFVFRGFPTTLRQNHLFFWLACLLFFLPGFITGLAAYNDPVLIYSIMDEHQVATMEEMYSPGNAETGRSLERGDEGDLTMFGYYIFNNISIGFRTFAGGILFTSGSVFFLLFNGITLGGVAGHLSHPPFATPFWQFVSGHGAFELTAIAICGSAGLILGAGLIRPGQYKRLDALRLKAPIALQLVMGGALMLVIAAFIEAFWSPSGFSPQVKYAVGAANWGLVTLYFLFAGRIRHAA